MSSSIEGIALDGAEPDLAGAFGLHVVVDLQRRDLATGVLR
jgi:hypothetical protein